MQDTVAIVLAGGEGRRLRPLTEHRCKPAVHFAQGCLIVDFAIANLANSGFERIVVIAQYKPDSLIDHLRRYWQPRLNADGRMLHVVLPQSGQPAHRFAGTADAVDKTRAAWLVPRPARVAIFAADHVYRMDVAQMLDAHRARAAEITVAALPVPLAEASAFGVIEVDADDRIRRFDEKPLRPAPMPGRADHAYASMGNYVFETGVLLDELDRARRNGHSDFGHDLLPACVGRRRMFAYDFSRNRVPGAHPRQAPYWRDVGTLEALALARAETSGPAPVLRVDDPVWPIRPPAIRTRPARSTEGAADGLHARPLDGIVAEHQFGVA